MQYRGIVQQGTQRAAKLGFPTVNIPLDDPNVSGVYAAIVDLDGKEYEAVAFADQKRHVLEAHMFDADVTLYGKQINIELREKVRSSHAFRDDDALRVAIAQDVASVREYFRARK